ncbi:MAG: ArsB/NhaD family transporter [Clostridia bacterium]|uniref:SLC13 family permease n=1 Tax=Mogibacterium sp. TaxID=2049035 RepID=UPI0025892CB8|nr:ArsB/NhaD family transporter [Mogibacterium sp.]MCI7124338.1 ArsB/NhaD family transporter [Mogibacterium sp.]MDY5449796.1 ArsB/NhaD family transporter [Clostridia bacterium]
MKIIAVAVFLIVILLIISERVHRTAAAMAGAMVLILTGVMSADKALSYIDFNTIGVLVGMMIFVAIVRRSGMFEYIAVRAAKAVHGDPWKIMVAFTLITAVLSAILDNVTTVLLVGPMSIAIARMLKIDPVPFLMGQILASNVGGTATLIGDPPNIMIGSAAHLSFMDFLENTGFAVLFILAVLILLMKIVYEKKIEMGTVDTSAIEKLDPSKSITNRALMRKGIIVLICVIVGFMFHDKLGIESSVIALTAAAVMLIIGREDVNEAIQDVEWTTILFFMSLFVVVGGLTETGIIKELASKIINATDGHPMVTMLVLLWASALLSSILDNIPFVATLIPLILAMQADGMDVTSFWWAISLGACLGGNGTMIGASANVVLSDISTKHGYPITFKSYLKVGMPFMLLSIVISTVFLVVKFDIM